MAFEMQLERQNLRGFLHRLSIFVSLRLLIRERECERASEVISESHCCISRLLSSPCPRSPFFDAWATLQLLRPAATAVGSAATRVGVIVGLHEHFV
ncbi:hypothetical protein OPV22_014839 [Ensete ventricosum]|uniref:Uncharacterized protein n=1 Tax=Ensete ventricosum TaxID=4639 RepID=A0AAV8PL03_ENSVE|nr:hypothetical protein OPV22_014839 [Ensete ventricosum]